MKYATKVSEIINAFSPQPLLGSEMDEFYCADTMEFRMGDKYCSPMEDIFEDCKMPTDRNSFLLLAHKGGGKSTELNRVSERLIAEGYKVRTISCSVDLDILNLAHSDLYVLLGEALICMADEIGCNIDQDILQQIIRFWDVGNEITTKCDVATMGIEGGATIKIPGILGSVFELFTKVKTDLKYNEEVRKEYRKVISIRSSDWISLLKYIAVRIAEKLEGKQPVIILEDLDKLNPEDAWKIFDSYAPVLSGFSFPIIYTFPIGLSYDHRFSALEEYFKVKILPIIKTETIDGEVFRGGVDIIKAIVEKRADLALFEADVLETMIIMTGGSLRDLFLAINSAARRAGRRRSDCISMADGSWALEELKTSLTRRIEKSDYEFLVNIHKGNKTRIEDKKKLLVMLQASIVLEYNGERWHNVHPIVAKYLIEQGIITANS